jgi:hypothetical protein
MRVFTIKANDTVARRPIVQRGIKTNKAEDTLAGVMVKYGFSASQARGFLEETAKMRAESIATRISIPADIANAILADMRNPQGSVKTAKNGKTYHAMQGGLIAFRIAKIAKNDIKKMVAMPDTINALRKAYKL